MEASRSQIAYDRYIHEGKLTQLSFLNSDLMRHVGNKQQWWWPFRGPRGSKEKLWTGHLYVTEELLFSITQVIGLYNELKMFQPTGMWGPVTVEDMATILSFGSFSRPLGCRERRFEVVMLALQMDENGEPYDIEQCQYMRAAYGGTFDQQGSRMPIQGIKLNRESAHGDLPKFTKDGIVLNGARVSMPPELSPYWELEATDFGPKGFPADLPDQCDLDGELNDGSGAGITTIVHQTALAILNSHIMGQKNQGLRQVGQRMLMFTTDPANASLIKGGPRYECPVFVCWWVVRLAITQRKLQAFKVLGLNTILIDLKLLWRAIPTWAFVFVQLKRGQYGTDKVVQRTMFRRELLHREQRVPYRHAP